MSCCYVDNADSEPVWGEEIVYIFLKTRSLTGYWRCPALPATSWIRRRERKDGAIRQEPLTATPLGTTLGWATSVLKLGVLNNQTSFSQ